MSASLCKTYSDTCHIWLTDSYAGPSCCRQKSFIYCQGISEQTDCSGSTRSSWENKYIYYRTYYLLSCWHGVTLCFLSSIWIKRAYYYTIVYDADMYICYEYIVILVEVHWSCFLGAFIMLTYPYIYICVCVCVADRRIASNRLIYRLPLGILKIH